MEKIEYRVRPVTRFIITRYEGTTDEDGNSDGSVAGRGEYDNADTAFEVAYALCKAEHDRLGWPLDDERIQYPRHPNDLNKPVTATSPMAAGSIWATTTSELMT